MSNDTTPDARAVQQAVIASMTGAQRIEAAIQMSETAKDIAIAGIRARNPEYDETAVKRAWFILLHGEELTDLVLGAKLVDA